MYTGEHGHSAHPQAAQDIFQSASAGIHGYTPAGMPLREIAVLRQFQPEKPPMPVLLSIHHAILHLPFKEKRHLVRNPLLHQSVGKAAGTRTGEGAARHPQENKPFPVEKISRKAILQKIPLFHVSRRHETFIPFPPASAPCSMSPLQNAPCGTGCILRPDKSPALAEDAKSVPQVSGNIIAPAPVSYRCSGAETFPAASHVARCHNPSSTP